MWLFLAFLAVPLIEIALFIEVGGAIGLAPTLGIVVLTAIIGTWAVRSQGRLALDRLRGSFRELGDPSEPLAHGAMILLAGALLLTPGFFTDALGFALLVPGVRRALMQRLARHVTVARFEMGPGAGAAPGPQARRPSPRPGPRSGPRPGTGPVIEGEWQEVQPGGETGAAPADSKRPTHAPSGWTRH